MPRGSRSFCVLLAAAFAFQVSDLSRLVYVQFNLAPTCPVVGEVAAQERTSCCPSPSRTVTQDDGDCHPDDQRTPSKPVSPSDCHTCRMYAAAHQMSDVQAPDAALFDDVSGYEPVLQADLSQAISDFPNHARAPPGA